MACEDRKEALAALLYGELEPREETELQTHIRDCAACRDDLQELTLARESLDHARPEVPIASPRVVVLRPAPVRRPLLAFAAGVACATALLGAGVVVGTRLGHLPGLDRSDPRVAANTRPVTGEELDQLLGAYGSRIDRLDRQNVEIRQAVLDPSRRQVIYRKEFDSEITKLGKVLDLRRATDLEVLLGEIRDAEFRAHDRIGQTQEAVRFVLLANDPRLSVE